MITDLFTRSVRNSRMLSREQKELLLEDPELFSPEYREHILSLVAAFDARSRQREDELRERINLELNALYDRLEAEHVPQPKREEILKKAMAAVQGLFVTT